MNSKKQQHILVGKGPSNNNSDDDNINDNNKMETEIKATSTSEERTKNLIVSNKGKGNKNDNKNKINDRDSPVNGSERVKEIKVDNGHKIDKTDENVEKDPDIRRINTNWECPLCQRNFNNPTILRVNSHIDFCLKTKKINNSSGRSSNNNRYRTLLFLWPPQFLFIKTICFSILRNKFTSKIKNSKRKSSESLLTYFEKDNQFLRQHKKIILEKQISREPERDQEQGAVVFKDDDIMKNEIVKDESSLPF